MSCLLPGAAHAGAPHALSNLLSEEALQARLATIYPSRHSLKWAIRKHRAVLARDGALFIINGRNWFDPERFINAVVSAGHMAALTSASSGEEAEVASTRSAVAQADEAAAQ